MPELIFIIILIIIVLLLILYNLYVKRNFKTVEKSRKRLDDLSVLNELVKITASLKPVNDKLVNINNILIEKFNIDYSSIIIFDGKRFVAKATNLDKKNIASIEKVYSHPIFADAIQTKEAKYITVENPTDNLEYLTEEKERVKTAIFYPLYIDSVFVGFWLIESKRIQAFKDLDMQIMVEIKSRLLDIVRTMSFQSSMENMVKQDLFSSLKTYEYLLTEGKLKLEKYDESTIIMYRISNLEQINEEFSRQAGNMTITNVTEAVNRVLHETKQNNIFVRYSGPRFAIAFPGIIPENLNVMESIKKAVESTYIMQSEAEQARIDEIEDIDILTEETVEDKTSKSKKTSKEKDKSKEKNEKEENKKIVPKLNIVAAKYYRGVGLEILTKELEDFLEELEEESSITIL